MAKKKRGGRRISGNPAKAAEQRQVEEYWNEVQAQPVPAYRTPTSDDWAQLERDLHAAYPRCPECGGPMVDGGGEEGADDAGNTVISLVLWCEDYDDENPAESPPHPLTSGTVELERTLR